MAVSLHSDVSDMAPEEVKESIRCTARLTSCLADALKDWLPVNSTRWLSGWSRWHVLCYILEETNETLLSYKSCPELKMYSVLLFLDEIYANVLLEDHSYNDFGDLSKSIGWIACSQSFPVAIKNGLVYKELKATATINKLVTETFTTAMQGTPERSAFQHIARPTSPENLGSIV